MGTTRKYVTGWLKLRVLGLALLVTGAALLSGCDMDSFADPSEIGRWENTPVVLPIIERLDVIDEPQEQIPGLSQVRSEDLIPEIREYEIGPGDLLTFTVFELITPNVETVVTRRVDELGYVRLPVIGQLKCAGLTTKQLEQRIVDILDPAILRNPTVSVVVQEGRQKTYSVIGSNATGTYQIVQNNFRLLDAMAIARAQIDGLEHIYVIRQVPLLKEVQKGFETEPEAPPGAHSPPMQPSGKSTGEAAPGQAPAAGQQPVLDPAKLIESLGKDLDNTKPDNKPNGPVQPDHDKTKPAPAAPAPGKTDAKTDINPDTPMPKPDAGAKAPAAGSNAGNPLSGALEPDKTSGEGRFVNLNGKWIWVKSTESAPGAGGAAKMMSGDKSKAGEEPVAGEDHDELPPPDQMVTQRVIDIDAEALARGEAKYNIVIRPGDVIRIPAPKVGNIYIGGHIARPGTYSLPGERTLTLKQLVISAGGLAPTGIPERVDLTRRLGKGQEVTVRLNLRSIFEGVEPDIFLKKNDTINVGTNVIASFAAVIRNSFRFSYGFGFLLDRNFGNDVLGIPPGTGTRR